MLTIAAAHGLPAPDRRSGGERRDQPAARCRIADAARLLRSRMFLLFLVAIGCTHGAHATFYTFGALHWQAQGLSAGWVGHAVGDRRRRRGGAVCLFGARRAPLRPVQLIVAGAGASVVRWAVMAFDPPLALLVPLQVLHALTYGAAHLGAIHLHHARRAAQGHGQRAGVLSP